MKDIFKFGFLFTVVLSVFINGFAQEAKITEKKFESLKNDAYSQLKDKNYRVKMTSESYKSTADSSPYYFINEVNEYLSPDRSHNFSERKTPEKITRSETITIGQKKYVRFDNEKWKQAESTQVNSGGTGGYVIGKKLDKSEKVEYKYQGKKNINNQKADLYEQKTKTIYNLQGREYITVITEKYWFSEKGSFLKRESSTEESDGKVTSHTVWDYEYDPTIKIKPPIK